MIKKRDFFGEWLESSYVDGQYTVPIFWTEFKRLFRALWVGIRYQPALTLVCLIGALSTPYVASNFAGGFTSKQANYNQPMPGIVAGQTGAFARTIFDVGGHATSSTIQYVSNQQQAPGLSPIQANRLIRQQQQQMQPTMVLGTGMGQY